MFSFAECIFVVAPNVRIIPHRSVLFSCFLGMLWSPYLPCRTVYSNLSILVLFFEGLNDEGMSSISAKAASHQRRL